MLAAPALSLLLWWLLLQATAKPSPVGDVGDHPAIPPLTVAEPFDFFLIRVLI